MMLKRWSDRMIHPKISVFAIERSAYHVWGVSGFFLALMLAALLIWRSELSSGVFAILAIAATATFFLLAIATKVITGKEYLIYYHHEIAILVVSTCVLWLWDQPILPYLDVVILGIGTFLAFGRVGCLMVGCCHGIPHRWGVCYRQEHADEGFTSYYVGVPLFPIQAVESLYVSVVVGIGVILAWNGTPGEALAWYVITYDIGRFSFEFMRGDPDRPYYGALSEGQWISLGLMLVVVWAEVTGRLNLHIWHLIATGTIVVVVVAVTLLRRYRNDTKSRVLNPHHIKEVMQTVELLGPSSGVDTDPSAIRVGCTSLGIQISTSRLKRAAGEVLHYALSSKNERMTAQSARALAELICRTRHPRVATELIEGDQGVFHLMVGADTG